MGPVARKNLTSNWSLAHKLRDWVVRGLVEGEGGLWKAILGWGWGWGSDRRQKMKGRQNSTHSIQAGLEET